MSKEETLAKYPSQIQGDYFERHCLDAMDEHAQQVAVAFAEWKDSSNVEFNSDFDCYFIIGSTQKYKTNIDLYQYFIDNVCNK